VENSASRPGLVRGHIAGRRRRGRTRRERLAIADLDRYLSVVVVVVVRDNRMRRLRVFLDRAVCSGWDVPNLFLHEVLKRTTAYSRSRTVLSR
jgi:hypothetical protein